MVGKDDFLPSSLSFVDEHSLLCSEVLRLLGTEHSTQQMAGVFESVGVCLRLKFVCFRSVAMWAVEFTYTMASTTKETCGNRGYWYQSWMFLSNVCIGRVYVDLFCVSFITRNDSQLSVHETIARSGTCERTL